MPEANFEALLRACEAAETESHTGLKAVTVDAEARVLGHRVQAVLDAQGLTFDPAACEQAAHFALNRAPAGDRRSSRPLTLPSLWELGGRSMLSLATLSGGALGMNTLAHLAESQGWLLAQHLLFLLGLSSAAVAQFYSIKVILQFPAWASCALLRLEAPSLFDRTESTGPR